MIVYQAKIKKSSKNHHRGLNKKQKSIWLDIVNFTANGLKNYCIKAVKVENELPVYYDFWISKEELTFRHYDDTQLSLF